MIVPKWIIILEVKLKEIQNTKHTKNKLMFSIVICYHSLHHKNVLPLTVTHIVTISTKA